MYIGMFTDVLLWGNRVGWFGCEKTLTILSRIVHVFVEQIYSFLTQISALGSLRLVCR